MTVFASIFDLLVEIMVGIGLVLCLLWVMT